MVKEAAVPCVSVLPYFNFYKHNQTLLSKMKSLMHIQDFFLSFVIFFVMFSIARFVVSAANLDCMIDYLTSVNENPILWMYT